jgi:adenylate cyclase
MQAKLKSLKTDIDIVLEDFNLIGRSSDASIRLVDGGVSRQHATIRRDGQLFWVSDLGSANGSFINDSQSNPATTPPSRLKPLIFLYP